MIRQLLEEVKAAPLDEASRNRLKEIHRASIKELEAGLAPELVEELERLSLPFTEEGTPSESELRIAQAQLVGWLEGLFHGIQTAIYAQQVAARAQLEQMRQLPPGASISGPQAAPSDDAGADSATAAACTSELSWPSRWSSALADSRDELRFHPISKRIRVSLGERLVCDTTSAVLVWEPRRVVPTYAVPAADLVADLEPAASQPPARPDAALPRTRGLRRALLSRSLVLRPGRRRGRGRRRVRPGRPRPGGPCRARLRPDHAVRLGRGGRTRDRPPARPLQADRRAAQRPPGRGVPRGPGAGRQPAGDGALRDVAPDPVVPAARRRATRPARSEHHPHRCVRTRARRRTTRWRPEPRQTSPGTTPTRSTTPPGCATTCASTRSGRI